MQHVTEQRSLGELFSELAAETGTLIRKEVELAKTEMAAKAQSAAKDAVYVGVGGVVAVMGALALFAALILALGTIMPLWASALLVGVVLAGAGAATSYYGIRALKSIDPKPRETIKTIEENQRWISEQVSR